MMRTTLVIFLTVLHCLSASAQDIDLDAGLIAHFPFNVDARDTVGEYHGTVHGPTLDNKRCGGSVYYFDGGKDYIDFGNDRSLNRRYGGLTVSVWILPLEISEFQLGSIVTKWAFDKLRDHFGMWINNSRKIIFAVSNRSVMEDGTFSRSQLKPEEWHHVVGTWQPDGEIRIYIDGELDNVGRQKGRGINTTSNVSLKAGRQVVRRDRPYKGYMDEVRIYARTLNDQEVRALHDMDRSRCHEVIVEGRVINKNTGEPVQGMVVFENLMDGMVARKVQTQGDDATYRVTLPISERFAFYAEAENYLAENQNLDTRNLMYDDVVYADLYVVPLEVGGSIRLNNIFFDFDKADLRPESYNELNRLLNLFHRFPKVKIELSGHTDSKGSDDYNLRLSDDRAQSVRTYLLAQGVDPFRIDAKGYGESIPVETNDTDEGRQYNRRVEFKVLEK
jgi:outer membrane protein OmpA-like peptidoglycan-associated protein